MTYFLIALILGCLFAVALLIHSDGYGGWHVVGGVAGAVLAVVCVIGIIIYAIMVIQWVGAKHQADIINREYGTNYTQAEVFYASSVIDTVRELDRKRVELNGDLLRGETPE